MTATTEKPVADRTETQDILDAYCPPEGVADEMMDAEGRIKPLWQPFVDRFTKLSAEERDTRFSRADQYLRDSGVFYRVYGEDSAQQSRDWPLSHIPVLMTDTEWGALTDGLKQRADLLEALVADIYGDNELVAAGVLPPRLVASNPEFLRSLVGVKPVGGHFLHLIAFDLGRGPDGNWWVLGDRTQAPSGSGFALENRVATSRAFADIQAEMKVHRIASFFRDFRDHLQSMRVNPGGQVAILTPGQANETYYEHAYIARYLGFPLLQGDDLTVINGQIMVRTISGMRPVSVLWRRMDASFADPLELNGLSYIGTPGMVEAVRQSGVAMINALGSGILETRALSAFLPSAARHLLGQELRVPSIATWWCGQDAERQHVIDNLDRMLIGPAMSPRLLIEDVENTTHGGSLDEKAKKKLIASLAHQGADLVGQEPVKLSTTPVYRDGKLVPRPMSLRVYLARTEQGWQIMPGGFARIGNSDDPSAITMQRGGYAADTWVVGSTPVDQVSLLQSSSKRAIRAVKGDLPSRAGDNLFWLGRYLERAEDMTRILRAYHVRVAEGGAIDEPLLEHVNAYLQELGFEASEDSVPFGFQQIVQSSLFSASQIRDRFSPDGWLALNDLAKTVDLFADKLEPGDDAVRGFTILLRKLAGFAGLLHENMYRFSGWRFLTIGRALERGLNMSRLLAHMVKEDAPQPALDLMLEIGDVVMTYHRRYSMHADRLAVLDLLALDSGNPRSVIFQLDQIKAQLELFSSTAPEDSHKGPMRDILRLHTELAVREADEVDEELLERLVTDLEAFSNHLGQAYFR